MPSLNIVCQKLVSLESYYGRRDVCTYRQADHNGGMADYRKARSHQTWTVDGFPHVGRHHGALRYHLVSRRISAVRAVTHERTPIITPREGRRRVWSHHADHHPTSDCRARGKEGRYSVNNLFADTDKHTFVFADIERVIKPRHNDAQEEQV